MTEIQLQHVTYVYGRGTPFEKKALDDVCLTFAPGKITGLMGHTGSGNRQSHNCSTACCVQTQGLFY